MRIGVLGDTHDRLANVERAIEILRGAGVERVVHTGDITRPATLERFSALRVPFYCVFGNNDDRDGLAAAGARLGFVFAPGVLRLDWAERALVVIHDRELLPIGATTGCDLLLHGHTHRSDCERQGELLAFNLGHCAGSGHGASSVGVVDLRTFEVRHLRF